MLKVITLFFIILVIFPLKAAQASTCLTNWPTTCNTGLPADINPVSEFDGTSGDLYVEHSQTDHFIFFFPEGYFDALHANYNPLFDGALFQEMKDQFECAYNYQVCNLGLTASSITEKLHVYVGDLGNTGGSKGYMTVTDYNIETDPSDIQLTVDYKTAKRHTVPVHEFFHIIHYNNYATNIYESITEGWAVLAEQMPSMFNFENSLVDTLRLEPFWEPEDSAAYGLSIFWRYVFEQLYGPPLNPSDVDEDWAVSDFLAEALNHLGTLGPNPNIVQFLNSFIPAYATVNSIASTPRAIAQNFVTARYAYQYVDSNVHPEFSFFNAPVITNALDGTFLVENPPGNIHLSNCPTECMNFYSYGNAMSVGTVLNFDNTNTIYGGIDPGFRYFLNGEYHILEPDLATVQKLKFTKTVYDNAIHFQLIIRYNDGTITTKNILQGNRTTRRITLSNPNNIAEIVFVVYTANYNPITSGIGRVFSVDVEAL